MSTSARIALLAVVAVVAFGAAFLLTGGGEETAPVTELGSGASSTTEAEGGAPGPSGDDDEDPCVVDDVVPAEAAGFEVTVATEPDPPVPQGTTVEVLVARGGAAVTGATVCLRADMSEMSHAGVRRRAEELGGGRYAMDVDFSMRGTWDGSVLVIESGQGASAPFSFRVQ